MIRPQITLDENPSPLDREAIFNALVTYNDTKVERPTVAQVAVLLRHPENGSVIGGLWAVSVYDWLGVELLFVPEDMRGNGIGSALMRKAEAVAANRGCVGVWLDTYSFQARGFYEKLGYELFGVLDDFPKGETRFFFRKLLLRAVER